MKKNVLITILNIITKNESQLINCINTGKFFYNIQNIQILIAR